MLRNPSLRLRAALIFAAIYLAVFAAGFMLLSTISLSAGEAHHAGANIALTFAADEMDLGRGSVRLPRLGSFAGVAAKNPALWLLVEKDGRRFAFGHVPPAADSLFGRSVGVIVAAKFHVPGVSRPWSDAVVVRRDTPSGPVWLAAGGVDPHTIGFADSFRFFLSQGLFALVMLGVVGLVATLVALPLVTVGVGRVAAEAAGIRPEHPGRRMSEPGVPRELLPLVRGFNAALDRLADEIVRRKRLVADIAHELRTPLAIVSLKVDALEEGPARTELQRVVVRLSHLVAQMLDVERLSLAGSQPEPLDLAALARDVVADMAPIAIASGYEISLATPDRPVTARADAHAVGRALANLVGNAIAHGGNAGQIRVTVGEARTIDVLDEGPGVAESVRERLFEPFARLRSDRDGCGLGLHLAREIMRAQGGDALLLPTMSGAGFRLQFA